MEPTLISFLGTLGLHKLYALNDSCFVVVLVNRSGYVIDLSAYSTRSEALRFITRFAEQTPDDL